MIWKNKLVISVVLLLGVAGGVTYMFNSMKVYGQNDDTKLIQEAFTNIE